MGIFCQRWVLHLCHAGMGEDLKLNLALPAYKRADLPILFAAISISP